jgi:thiol-disulfide isomerase/thioredoxin/uncharacterized membrane protein YphA (DoxX/SURF4 family)
MDMIIVALQIGLASVLAVAALGKFLDLPGSRKAVQDFGVPKNLAEFVGTALPAAELGLAIFLLPGATARWAAIVAAALFLAFILGIAYNNARGRQPDCHCFGQFHSAPAGQRTIARNVAFTLAALIVAWRGSPGPIGWFSGLQEISQVVVLIGALAVVILGVQTWLLLRLTAQNAELINRLGVTVTPVLPILGDDSVASNNFAPRSAPPFELPALAGGRVSLQSLMKKRKPILLLFVDPRCGPCRTLVPDIHEWHRRFADELTVALISRGSVAENREKFGDLPVALQDDREIYDLYDVEGTPSGILISPTGMIWDPYAPGRDHIRDLVVRVMRGEAGTSARANAARKRSSEINSPDPREALKVPAGPEVGTRGTRLPLPDLEGGYVGLDDLRGERRVILFFSPDCAFCQGMLPDLEEWEQEAGEGTERVLIVSSGTVGANRELGLQSRIVIDSAFTTGNDYGATGTPSAIVIDEEGRVDSPLAVGADAVLDLLDAEILQLAASNTGNG